MAAPTASQWYTFSFRDSRGEVSRMRGLIGDATFSAVEGDAVNGKALLQAVSNAHVYLPAVDGFDRTYGATAEYETSEDKAVLTFADPAGFLHRFQIPAPLAAGFLADKETVNSAETNMAALITWMSAYLYGRKTDTAALTYIGGVRIRRKTHRKLNIMVKNPALTGPGE
jgi:hypothetical protein